MPRPSLTEIKYLADGIPTYVASVNGSYTGTTAGTIKSFGATERYRLKFIDLTVFVATILAGNETAGDYLIMYDEAVTAPIHVLGVLPIDDLIPGSIFGTTGVGDTTFTTAATIYNTALPMPTIRKEWPLGYTASAAGNDIKFALVGSDDGAVEDVATGLIRAVGTIGYDLV